MVVSVAHNLQTFSFLLKIIKDELFAHMSNVRDSACQRNLLFEPSSILGDWGIFFSKLVDGHFDMELVRIWIGVGIFLEFINHFGSVFEVSCGV